MEEFQTWIQYCKMWENEEHPMQPHGLEMELIPASALQILT